MPLRPKSAINIPPEPNDLRRRPHCSAASMQTKCHKVDFFSCLCLPACTSGVLKHHQGAVRKMHLNAGWGTSNKTGKKCDAKAFLGSNAGAKKNILPTRLCSFSNTIHRRKRHKDPDTRCCSDSPLLSKWVTGCIMSLAGVFWPG